MLNVATFTVRYHLRGKGPVAGPVAVAGDGGIVVGFGDRTVHGHATLR